MDKSANHQNWWSQVFHLYYDGFKNMTVGKTLWVIIALKLFVFFIILRLIFFPNFLSTQCDNDEEKTEYVRDQLINR